MFRNAVRLYIYPMREAAYERYVLESNGQGSSGAGTPSHSNPNVLINAKNVRMADHLSSLYAYLLENRCVECIVGFDADALNIFSRDVLKKIREHDPAWEKLVPVPVAEAIKRRGLFGHADKPIVV
jgi:hypothetical protein